MWCKISLGRCSSSIAKLLWREELQRLDKVLLHTLWLVELVYLDEGQEGLNKGRKNKAAHHIGWNVREWKGRERAIFVREKTKGHNSLC